MLAQGRLPASQWNVPVEDGDGRVGLVEALWPVERVVLELDGLRFHSSDEQRRRDRARGYRVRSDVRQQPGLLTTQIRRALATG